MPVIFECLGWERPLPEKVAERLRKAAAVPGEYDDYLLWLPSARSGRHVLQELFSKEGKAVEAFHPPRLTTPAQFRRNLLAANESVASEVTCLLAWKEILAAAPVEVVEAIFVSGIGARTASWAYGFGENLHQLRQRLAEDDHGFASVAASCPANDRARWEALRELEDLWLAWLADRDLIDPESAELDEVAGFLREEPVKALWIAGVLNLTRRQERLLRGLEEAGVEVTFLLPAPEAEAGAFDRRGRPLPECWAKRPLPEDLLRGRIHRGGDPRVLAPVLYQLCHDYSHSVDSLLVGTSEPETARYLIDQGPLGGVPLYAPEGESLAETRWGGFLILLHEFLDTERIGKLLDLLLFPPLRMWIRREGGETDKAERALRRLQSERVLIGTALLWDAELRPDHDLQCARELLSLLDRLWGELRQGRDNLFVRLWKVLRSLAETEEGAEGVTTTEQARALHGLFEELCDMPAVAEASEADQWFLLRKALDGRRFYRERRADERPVSGWLEFAFERAPHLALFGLPDAAIPGSGRAEAFLVPPLARHLGLYGLEEEEAFHAFRLRYVLESRRESGRVDILLPDRALDGTPQIPSRFLLHAGEEEVLPRVTNLLTGDSAQRASVPSEFGDRLHLPEPEAPARISVTAFRAWLADPFRFFLERMMGWEVPLDREEEMDAKQFGSLLHVIFCQYNAKDEGKSLSRDAETTQFLLDTLQAESSARFGRSPPLAVRIQRDVMEQRLRALAPHLAGERRAGWLPLHAEWKIHDKETGQSRLTIEGLPVSGVIDLVERHEESGELRVLDYKTSDSADTPFKAHLGKVTAASGAPPLAEVDFELGGKTYRWKDLQLPLYAAAAEKAFGKRPRVGYVNLPKTVMNTGLAKWTEGDPPVAQALRCAGAVVRAVREGIFWPPSKGFATSDWQPWLGPVPADCLADAWLLRHGKEVP